MAEPGPSAFAAQPFANPLANAALLADPYPFYAMLRQNNPVFRVPIPVETGAGVWLLTRFDDVEQVLRDRRFSVERRRADVARLYADRIPSTFLGGPQGLRTMLIMDPPDHTRVRGLVSKAFTPRRVAALAPRIEALVHQLLDEALARGDGRLDVIHDLAEPLPAIVIAELLGIPAEDHRRFKQWSSRLIEMLPEVTQGGAREFEAQVEQILAYLREAIAARRREPGDDLISGMIEAQEARDALTERELVSTSFLLLLAGHETTTNLIGNGTLALLRHPEQLERLRAEPELVDNAVEELLRFDSPVQATVRIPLEEVAIGGHRLAPGALVACGIGAANRDPAANPDPDRLDVARSEPRHLSFGIGAHFCLGAALARLEGRLAFAGLLSRCKELRLQEGAEIAHRPNLALRGLRALPVEVG